MFTDEYDVMTCPDCCGKGGCPFCSSTGTVYRRKETAPPYLNWYRAWFVKEQDYQIQELNNTYFDILAEIEDARDEQCASIEDAGWGALTHWQYMGKLTERDAERWVKVGKFMPYGKGPNDESSCLPN